MTWGLGLKIRCREPGTQSVKCLQGSVRQIFFIIIYSDDSSIIKQYSGFIFFKRIVMIKCNT